jgi:hypothetical protein
VAPLNLKIVRLGGGGGEFGGFGHSLVATTAALTHRNYNRPESLMYKDRRSESFVSERRCSLTLGQFLLVAENKSWHHSRGTEIQTPSLEHAGTG